MADPDHAVLDGLHDQIQAALDMYPPELWTIPDCRSVLDFFSEIAVAALRAEVEEVGR